MAYMEANKPKSKVELYKEKLKERDLYSNVLRFTENGAGAPLRNNDGSIITKMKSISNTDYDDINLNQRNATPNPINYTNNQQMNLLNQTNVNNNIYNNFNNDIFDMNNNNYSNNNFAQTLPIRNRNLDLNNIYNINNNIGNENQNEETIINNNYQIINSTRRPQSQNNFSNTLNPNRFNNNINLQQENINDPFGNSYQGTGILPREKSIEDNKKSQNQILREEWLKEIEDKRIREAKRKQEQKELELRLEQKYEKDKKEILERENLEKYNEENRINRNMNTNINNMVLENNIQNNNNNNQQTTMVMNGNNLEPLQQDDFQNQEQTFKILRDPNTNIMNNIDNFNNYEQINEFNIDSNPRELEDNINEQISKLRNDVNSQYVEMSNLFGKLRMDVIEANQLKNEAEKELQYIKRELAKNKMASLAYDAQLNQVLERHAPYNNLHINVKEVDPLYSARNAKKDLQSESNFIYAKDMVNEGNINNIRKLNSLTQAGQNLISLNAESEFIPINNPGENNGNDMNNLDDLKNNIAISQTGYKNLESESYPIFQKDDNNFPGNNEPKILDDYMNKGEYSNMYKQLVDIANINSQMGAENKLKTINKNYEVDFRQFNEKREEEQKDAINNLDQLLAGMK